MDLVKNFRNKVAAFILAFAMFFDKLASGAWMQNKMFRSTAGEATAKAMVGLVVGLTVALIVIGYVLPVGYQGYHAINETLAGFTSQESAMYGVLGIFAMIAVLLALISKAVES